MVRHHQLHTLGILFIEQLVLNERGTFHQIITENQPRNVASIFDSRNFANKFNCGRVTNVHVKSDFNFDSVMVEYFGNK